MSVLFFSVYGEWIVARNKQIARKPLRGSRDFYIKGNFYIKGCDIALFINHMSI